MDAYVFVSGATDGVMRELERLRDSEESGVRFVTSVSGPFDAIAAVSVESFDELESTVTREIRAAGAAATNTAIALPHLPIPPLPAPKWSKPAAVEAFVRARVEPGRAVEVLERAGEIPGILGAAIVAGDFDVLLEIGGDTFEEVAGILVEHLHRLPGLRHSDSLFASLAKGSEAT